MANIAVSGENIDTFRSEEHNWDEEGQKEFARKTEGQEGGDALVRGSWSQMI